MKKTALTALVAAAVLGSGIYWLKAPESKAKIAPVAASAPAASMDHFLKQPAPVDLPPLTFTDASGAEKGVEALKGKVTLLNLWATWCAPCRVEMPELAQLQHDLGGPDFQVVELSQDLKGYEASAKFLNEVGAGDLILYADEKGRALDALKAPGLPTTLLLDRQGREVGRLIGPAAWAGDEAKAMIKGVIAAP